MAIVREIQTKKIKKNIFLYINIYNLICLLVRKLRIFIRKTGNFARIVLLHLGTGLVSSIVIIFDKI